MTDNVIKELRRVANNATHGCWKVWGMTVMSDMDGSNEVDRAVPIAKTFYLDRDNRPRTFDADHIAAFDPQNALVLLDRLEAAEARVAELEARLQWMGDRKLMDYQGRCGVKGPQFMVNGQELTPSICRLPHGHGGWHKGDDGTEFSNE